MRKTLWLGVIRLAQPVLIRTYNAARTDQSAGKAADSLKAQIHALEEERKAATLKAETMATKTQRLGEAIENLQAGALRAMRQQDEAAARELLQVPCIPAFLQHTRTRQACADLVAVLVSRARLCVAGKDTGGRSTAKMQG